MDEDKRNLIGSETRDIFRRAHKELPGDFYATDGDLILVSKNPLGIVAYLDYKTPFDCVSFTEAVLYNEWMPIAPVYIVEGADPANGPFTVKRYLGANWRPEPPIVNWGDVEVLVDWTEFEAWERQLRMEYKKRGGWRGCLRGGE